MTPNEYLESVLKAQGIASDSTEIEALQTARAEVEALLRAAFADCSPTIRYGGSKAKGTMILEDYDLDVICYFPHDQSQAGETLQDIYKNVRTALQKTYVTTDKTSAIRVSSKEKRDFHIDVVPGRFVDDRKSDAFLHQAAGEKKWLKTNLQTHIDHIMDSGQSDVIRLLKLWRLRSGLAVKTFALDLLAVALLKDKKLSGLEARFTYVLSELRDHVEEIRIEDPANPQGNDLSELLNRGVRSSLAQAARSTLMTAEASGWEQVFGEMQTSSEPAKVAALTVAAAQVSAPTRPWSDSE